ncbi:efflux RND transporter periplasmic adaptor subunit [Methylococcus geothermalis]|uniref:Efflux RND transporter periplasmic adaptor subunit n=1 Tax=Methylococcus geothermalis TaxID=2681310 RepID=A0A858Q8C4_9GAMM|nr:efflux RND transporter periplasmic adaptor subunit [Methylococcus geothermalis]QJD30077.1 efflux RND transporter periplasmic adaptor subunit [Methylococcus geothermalis]
MNDKIHPRLRVALYSLVAVGLLQLDACGGRDGTGMPGLPGPKVEVSQPVQREIIETDEYTGRLQAVESVEVRARVSGYLKQILFTDGSRVKRGDLLFVIDPRPYVAQLQQAQAGLARAKSKLKLAQNDLQRAESPLKEQAISEEEYDTRRQSLIQAMADVESAKASVDLAQLNVDFTQIRSPIDGRISRKLITEGNLVTADSTVLAGIVSVDPMYLYFDADERSLLKYRRLEIDGKRKNAIPIEMALMDEQGFPHHGYLDYMDPQVNADMGTVRARGVVANPDGLLEPGLFIRARVPGGSRYQGLLISDRAIAMDQGKKYVMVVTADNRADYRPITTGRLHEGLRIVSGGLSPEDWVIVNGLQFVRPGAQVEAARTAMPGDRSATGAAQ